MKKVGFVGLIYDHSSLNLTERTIRKLHLLKQLGWNGCVPYTTDDYSLHLVPVLGNQGQIVSDFLPAVKAMWEQIPQKQILLEVDYDGTLRYIDFYLKLHQMGVFPVVYDEDSKLYQVLSITDNKIVLNNVEEIFQFKLTDPNKKLS